MVISGKGSDRDIVKALDILKNKQMGTTHEHTKDQEVQQVDKNIQGIGGRPLGDGQLRPGGIRRSTLEPYIIGKGHNRSSL